MQLRKYLNDLLTDQLPVLKDLKWVSLVFFNSSCLHFMYPTCTPNAKVGPNTSTVYKAHVILYALALRSSIGYIIIRIFLPKTAFR
jgi:hypothetical protein